jgi:phosphoserine phosphatase RsbU/P
VSQHRAEPGEPDKDLFDAAPCGYVVLDAAGIVVLANAEFSRMVGVTAGELVGIRSFSSLLSTGGRILLETHLLPMLEHEGAVREISLELLRPDGDRVPVILNASIRDRETMTVLVIMLETRDRHRYEDDLRTARRAAEVARASAAATAATLQRTLIPPHPPAVPHLDIEAVYRPAGSGREVGGDFYDVFQVAPDSWVVVLGDVSGKGVPAAVVTSFVRYTIRSLAMVHPDPSELLGALHDAVVADGTDHYCTVVLARLEWVESTWDVALSLAGHPPALVRRPDGRIQELGVPGTPVGLVTTPEFHTVRHRLGTEAVTLYTDGVTEARSDQGLFGEQRLVELLTSLPDDPLAITGSIAQAALAWQSGDASDDIAIVSFAAI